MTCPLCGEPTPNLELRYGTGASAVVKTSPSHCRLCLVEKVQMARADGVCHCAEFGGPHQHEGVV